MEGHSLLSDATTKNLSGEISDSNSSNNQFSINHPMHGGGASSSKFKGVVSQPNGHWGAQIYTNHQRIWLGTFKSETEAAMAYDSAAIRLRNGQSPRNFPWANTTVHEPHFQSQFSTETLLGMIKDGSYAARFSDFLKAQHRHGYCLSALHGSPPGVKLKQLFQKELTPSDVGKLNRLVIPKKYAVKYFPGIRDVKKQNSHSLNDLELVFFDRLTRSWKFRYCYWRSSQSFVFTRGWNGFAKEKGLRPRDRVIFSSYDCNNQKVCVIDVAYHDGARNGGAIMAGRSHEAIRTEQPDNHGITEIEREDIQHDIEQNAKEEACGNVKGNVERKKGLKLFGVQIV